MELTGLNRICNQCGKERKSIMQDTSIFHDLFVLEVTNNHRGSVERGLEIIKSFSKIIHSNNIRNAAIKFQFRNIKNIIHKNYKTRSDIRYIRRILETQLSKEDYSILINAVRENGCIPMATPFDEESVDWCVDFDLPIIKVASVDSSDWFLLENIAETKKPIIVSTGGTSLEDIDLVVGSFGNRNIPLAINHCIAAYPNEDSELELDQISFLKSRYPNHVIGFSSHEHLDWSSSLLIAYALGARLFERHIDVGENVSPYSSLPNQVDVWFKAYNKAKEMCGDSSGYRKTFSEKEREYLDSHIRGIYAAVDLDSGHILSRGDIYLAVPLQKAQLSTREFSFSDKPLKMLRNCKKDAPITVDMLETKFSNPESSKKYIENRGIE